MVNHFLSPFDLKIRQGQSRLIMKNVVSFYLYTFNLTIFPLGQGAVIFPAQLEKNYQLWQTRF
jgi:hypothetical protein